ncbi:hypothetical protein ACHAWU_000925 [Discostella pseudostelligera]|uniref:Uncharacterized protein n=1 Tax=Discostella pseudostelligera TaxID=259834 RepID=A0ABD3MHC0_9STRA
MIYSLNMSDEITREQYFENQFQNDKPNAIVIDRPKRPPSPPSLTTMLNNLPIEYINDRTCCKRHASIDAIDSSKAAKKRLSASRLYHMPADNLVHCPVVHIPAGKKKNLQTTDMSPYSRESTNSLEGENETVPSAVYKDEQTTASYTSHHEHGCAVVQDVCKMEAPTECKNGQNAVKCKYPRRGAIAIAHDDASEDPIEHKYAQTADVMCESPPRHAKASIQCSENEMESPTANPPAMIELSGIISLTSTNANDTISTREVNNFLSKIDWDNS